MQLTPPQTPQAAEFDALRNGLNGFNEAVTGPLHRERIASFIKDEEGVVLGGILGEIKWGWLHIEGLWGSGSMGPSAKVAGAPACSQPWSSTSRARASPTIIWKPPVFRPSPSIRSRATRSLASCRICRRDMSVTF